MEKHLTEFKLADVILGGQDGIVNVLGVVLGVAAASGDVRLVVAAGLAATFAESVSMAAVAFTSKNSEADFYESELAREKREIEEMPAQEAEEIRQIYLTRGFSDELLEAIVAKITAEKEVWLKVMMAEELHLEPVERRKILPDSLLVGFSAILGSLIPLIPFFFLPVSTSVVISLLLTGVSLLFLGAYKARVTVGRPLKSGLQMAVIGLVSALAGYLIGILFRVWLF